MSEANLRDMLLGHHGPAPRTILPTQLAAPVSWFCSGARRAVTRCGAAIEGVVGSTQRRALDTLGEGTDLIDAARGTAFVRGHRWADTALERVGTRGCARAAESLQAAMSVLACTTSCVLAIAAGSLYIAEGVLGSNDTSAGLYAFGTLLRAELQRISDEDAEKNAAPLGYTAALKMLAWYIRLQNEHNAFPQTRRFAGARRGSTLVASSSSSRKVPISRPPVKKSTSRSPLYRHFSFAAIEMDFSYDSDSSASSPAPSPAVLATAPSLAGFESTADFARNSDGGKGGGKAAAIGGLLRDLYHYSRLSSAAYGYPHLRVFGFEVLPPPLGEPAAPSPSARAVPKTHHTFAQHSNILLDNILGSSEPSQEIDLIAPQYFVSVDHSRAEIVVTIRGTVGIPEMVTNVTCDAADFAFRGESFKVHRGILAIARFMARPGSPLHAALAQALGAHAGYALKICGHSLGGAVGSLLGLMWTAAASSDGNDAGHATARESGLPADRAVQVFVFGAPCVCDARLSRTHMRGLVHSVCWEADFISTLRLGHLRPFARALRFLKRNEHSTQLGERELYEACRAFFDEEAAMPHTLFAPGTVYWAKQQPLDSDSDCGTSITPESRRSEFQLYRVDDPAAVFSETAFTSHMLHDHNPRKLQQALKVLMD